tara:strand:- start:2837 stop:3277 length:441 start_codon:yes stop_codon:yes gene_type:complete
MLKVLNSPNDSLRLFFAMILGYIVSMNCKMGKGSGNNVKFRPPSYLFGIVWPILYILLGISWINSYKGNKNIDLLFIILSLLLAIWIIVYSCMKDKKNAIFILLLILLSIVSLMILIPQKSKLYLAPLLVWILFATFLNTTEVQNS